MVRRFLNNLGSLMLSLILATLVWIAAIREQNPPRQGDYDRNIPIEIIPPSPGLITTDTLPEIVRLSLQAPESSWSTLTPSKFKASLDLSQLPEGFNDVPIQVSVSDPQVKIVEQIPKDVSVFLEKEQTISLPIQVEVIDEPPLGYVSRSPEVEPKLVSITGPASLIAQVDKAVTDIFIRNARETIERTSQVIIRNRDDQVINDLTVTPPRVQVNLPIEQRFGYKDVSVSAVVEGQPAPGYWISNILVSPPRLTIVGSPRTLGSTPGFIETAPINVNQATKNIVQVVPLKLANGVTVVLPEKESGSPGSVEVTVEIAAIESGQTVQRSITQQGIDPDYVWTASPERADVILSGPIPRLQTLTLDDVKVIVDLFGLKPGTYKLRPTVFLPDDLRVKAILPDTIEVTISPNPRLALTPTPPLPVATPTLTPTQTATVTPTSSAADTRQPKATLTKVEDNLE
jgi:YbbR domain-containing protein